MLEHLFKKDPKNAKNIACFFFSHIIRIVMFDADFTIKDVIKDTRIHEQGTTDLNQQFDHDFIENCLTEWYSTVADFDAESQFILSQSVDTVSPLANSNQSYKSIMTRHS